MKLLLFSLILCLSMSIHYAFTSSTHLKSQHVTFLQLSTVSLPHNTYDKARKGLSDFAKTFVLTSTILTTIIPSVANAAAPTEAKYIDGLSTLLVTKSVLKPVQKYIFDAKYDFARTNVNYCLNQLQLGKAVDAVIQGSIDFCDDTDAIDKASEASQAITNTAVQLDSTIYTCVFIPSEDGEIPPTAEKYRKQTYDFLKTLNSDIDLMLALGSPDQLTKAKAIAAERTAALPILLFKDTQFQKPAGG